MPLAAKRLFGQPGAPVSRSRWTKDGKFLITCGHDKSLRLWNPLRSSESSEADGRANVSVSPSLSSSAAAAPAPLEQALQIKEYSGPHGQEIVDVAIASDNASFASCGGDRACFLWDVTGGHVLRRFEGHTARVNSVALNRDDSVLLTASYDQTVRLWDLRARSREPVQVLEGFRDSVTSVRASAHEVLTSCVDGALRVHDLRTGLCHADTLQGGEQQGGVGGDSGEPFLQVRPVTCASFSHDGKCVLGSVLSSAAGAGQGGGAAAAVVLLEKATGQVLNRYLGHAHASYGLESALTMDDAHVVSGSEDGKACVWDLVDGAILQRLEGRHTKAVTGVAPHPKEGKYLVTSSLDGTAILWEGTFGV